MQRGTRSPHRRNRSLTVTALIGAARVSKRFWDRAPATQLAY